MPIDFDNVDALAVAVAGVYREGETALLRAVRDRLDVGLDRTTWQAERLAAVGANRRTAQGIANRVAASGNHAVRTAVASGYRAGVADAVRELGGLLDPHQPRPDRLEGAAARRGALAVQALARATLNETSALHSRILPQADNAYRRAIAGAAARRLSGGANLRESAQAAWATLYRDGITSYTDSAGRNWRLHTYVEMATRAAVTRSTVYGLTDQFTAEGVNLASVDSVNGECELCRPFEMQVLRLDDGPTGHVRVPAQRGGEVTVNILDTLDGAMRRGLFHPHCRHTIRAYLPGVSILLRQGRTASPEAAEARDRQREIERHLRRWREHEAAALTDYARRLAARYVAQWDAEMVAHCAAHDLTRLHYRETIGAGFVPPPGRFDDIVADLRIPTDPTIDV